MGYAAVLHFTWLVNSAAHLMGDHPYDVLSYPAENPFVSFFAVGEGWHNWHHKYPFDYSASEFGVSSQFNPSRLLIDILHGLGLCGTEKVQVLHGRLESKEGIKIWQMASNYRKHHQD